MRTEFGQRLRDLREDHDLKQWQIAEILGVDRSAYAYYEAGRCEPSIASLKKLAALYEITIDTLVNGTKGRR